MRVPETTYLNWVLKHTKTVWWHDSADPKELALGLERGAIGVTTNPFLVNAALSRNKQAWGKEIEEILWSQSGAELKAEALTRLVVSRAAEKLLPEYERGGGASGYVCAQVNPLRAADHDAMLAMARRFHAWAPNIAVKLPATAAGLATLEDCIAEGITATATVSFTVPQVIAIAERCRQGMRRARGSGVKPGHCFAVIMIGRLDDYLREVAQDTGAQVGEADIRQAGLAVTKRACAIYRERNYETVLLVAALRGNYHFTELAGANLVMSIAPAFQEPFVTGDFPRKERIHEGVPADTIERLSQIPEFVKAYEPDGMSPAEFISYGVTQRTLAQFCEAGWKPLENFK